MTTNWTTAQADGYCTAWPARDFGQDKVAAILATGVRAADLQWTARPSYVAVRSGTVPVSLRSARMEDARLEAIALSAGAPVLLCLRLAAHPAQLLQKIELLRPDATGERIVAPSGHAIEKATNPLNPFDFRALINKVATTLRTADREFARPLLAQYFDRLRVDWTALGPRQIAQVLSDARAFLGTLPIAPLVGAWQSRLTITLEDVARKTKRVIRNAFLPSVSLSLSLEDREAIADIARQPGLFVRDEFGRRSDALTRKARKVIANGLKDGLGRDAIARDIERIGAGYWNARGFNYARVVAANSVSRARSFSELISYRQVGIEQLEITAVLDERTTDQCFIYSTLVDTPNGKRQIGTLRSGDEVITGFGLVRKIHKVMTRHAPCLIEIDLSSGAFMHVTANHPILVRTSVGAEWKRAGALRLGDELVTRNGASKLVEIPKDKCMKNGELVPGEYLRASDSSYVRVIGREIIPEQRLVYNLEVEDDPTYIAEGVIVHNCRAIDGTIIDVSDAWSHSQEINAIQTPEEIYRVAPFLQTRTNQQTGNREVTAGGKVYAEVLRSGRGVANDRGDLRLRMGPSALRARGISMPPYHHNCRTYTVPRTSYIQVPVGSAARTYPQPASAPSGSVRAAQRPANVIPEPTQRKPVDAFTPPPEVPPPGNVGKAARPLDEIIQRAMGAIIPVMGEAIARAGRELTRKETGRALRRYIEAQVTTPMTGKGVQTTPPDLEGLPFRTTALNQAEAWRRGLQFATPSLRAIVLGRNVPTIRAGAMRGYYPERNLIVVRSLQDEAALVRAVQLYVDTLGDHRWAGNALRASRALPGELVRLSERTYALDGPWLDRADGRVWHRDPAWVQAQYEQRRAFTASEIARVFVNAQPTALWANMAPRCLKGREEALAVVWERFPEQLAGYMALQSGALMEVADAR